MTDQRSQHGRCLQCGAERPDSDMVYANIVEREFDHRIQKQRVVTNRKGPFCGAQFKQEGEPACGAAYQMGCEG